MVAILHNNDLSHVTRELRAMGGAPAFRESQSLPDVDYAGFASSLGLQGITVTSQGEVGPAWEKLSPRIGQLFWMCIPIPTFRPSLRTAPLSRLSTRPKP